MGVTTRRKALVEKSAPVAAIGDMMKAPKKRKRDLSFEPEHPYKMARSARQAALMALEFPEPNERGSAADRAIGNFERPGLKLPKGREWASFFGALPNKKFSKIVREASTAATKAFDAFKGYVTEILGDPPFFSRIPESKSAFRHNNIQAILSNLPPLQSRISADDFMISCYQEKMKVCSGRDELCHSVLNDEWASHPTWASEDSGFVAHRKNGFEEALHRIEEERHDYDFNIEALSRTVQLLQPYAQQLKNMNEQERKSMRLPEGLGGQSRTIHKRVIKKMYGREKGAVVCQGLVEEPCEVVPLLINRLQAKLEEWKAAQVSTTRLRLLLCPGLMSLPARVGKGLARTDK